MKTKWILLILILITSSMGYGQKIIRAEYFFDTDPGQGNGTPLTITQGDSILQNITANTTGLSPGLHNIYIRVKDSTNIWSVPEARPFQISNPYSTPSPTHKITSAEYFIDTDPGQGNGTPLSFSITDSINQSFNIPLSVLDSGYHYMCVRVRDSIGQWSIVEMDSFRIIGCNLPTANFSCPSDICLGDTLFLTNTTTGTDQWIKYDWDINNDTVNDFTASGDTMHIYSVTGTYQIKLKATNSPQYISVCPDSITKTVTVHELPQTNITTYGPTSFCPGDYVTIGANNSLGYTYQWLMNDTIIANATISHYNAYTIGNYSAEITNIFGCADTSIATSVSIYSLPSAFITPSASTTFCQGDSITLNANTGAGLSYVWKKNGNIIAGQTGASINVAEAGIYIVEITNSNNCQSVSYPITIIVNPLPNATITAGGATTICQGDILQLYGTSGSGYSYQWLTNLRLYSFVSYSKSKRKLPGYCNECFTL